jgi:hypothetical protein
MSDLIGCTVIAWNLSPRYQVRGKVIDKTDKGYLVEHSYYLHYAGRVVTRQQFFSNVEGVIA